MNLLSYGKRTLTKSDSDVYTKQRSSSNVCANNSFPQNFLHEQLQIARKYFECICLNLRLREFELTNEGHCSATLVEIQIFGCCRLLCIDTDQHIRASLDFFCSNQHWSKLLVEATRAACRTDMMKNICWIIANHQKRKSANNWLF